jgi:hypothetical protein
MWFAYQLIDLLLSVVRGLPLFLIGFLIGGWYWRYALCVGVFYLVLIHLSSYIPICLVSDSGSDCVSMSERTLVSMILEVIAFSMYVPVLIKIKHWMNRPAFCRQSSAV